MVFGEFVRQKRREKKLSVRALAEVLGISPVYQSSIETGKRSAPSYDVLTPAESAAFYDMASESCSDKTVAMDIVEYINEHEEIRTLIRAARDDKISQADIEKLNAKAAKPKRKRSSSAK